jgi:hypothetical protein
MKPLFSMLKIHSNHCVQAFSYSVPSWVLGLIVAQIFGYVVANWFKGITGVPISPILTHDAVLMATGLGLLIPIIASIFPIRNALGMYLPFFKPFVFIYLRQKSARFSGC